MMFKVSSLKLWMKSINCSHRLLSNSYISLSIFLSNDIKVKLFLSAGKRSTLKKCYALFISTFIFVLVYFPRYKLFTYYFSMQAQSFYLLSSFYFLFVEQHFLPLLRELRDDLILEEGDLLLLSLHECDLLLLFVFLPKSSL